MVVVAAPPWRAGKAVTPAPIPAAPPVEGPFWTILVPALLLAVSFVLLVLVLVPPFGGSINGTRRWLRLGPLSFQPVELAKFALVLYLASFLTRRRQAMEHEITSTLADAASVGEALPKVIRIICEGLDWTCGFHWSWDRPAELLRCREHWYQGVAGIDLVEFQGPGKIGMPGPRSGDAAFGSGIFKSFPNGHHVPPVFPVLVVDLERDRCAGRHAVADAAQRFRAIGFDRHASAAAVAALAAPQFGRDRVEIDGETGRNTFDDRDERPAMRLARCEKTQHAANHSI